MARATWQDVLGNALAVTLDLPVAPSSRPLTTNALAMQLLDAEALLEKSPSAQTATDDPPSPALQRLELKIDLLMGLVASLLANTIPPRITVHLSAAGLVLPHTVLPCDCERIEWYPCQRLAQPLVLAIGPLIYRDNGCGAVWNAPDSTLREALERWIFRLHRRDIAHQRQINAQHAAPRP